jgi:peptidoglycan-N-acetylglucosamine deacetylase
VYINDVSTSQVNDSIIYLTFDDGLNAVTTPKLLRTLDDKGIKTTFFVTGNGPDDLIKREYADDQ